MKCPTFAGIATAILLAISSVAFAAGQEGTLLSADDYTFLARVGTENDNVVLQKMSPKELRHIHNLINDQRTQSDQQSRVDSVIGALSEAKKNQQWETSNPGKLWDDKKPPLSGGVTQPH